MSFAKKWGFMPKFSKALFNKIVDRISNGESLRKICEGKGMPDRSSVFRWLADDEKLRDQYARARDWQADAYADDCTYIADTEDDPQKARVMIDARKWHAGKLAPKKYGDKLTLDAEDGLAERFARAMSRDT